MKASKQLIALLTVGQINYAEISQTFGVSDPTARRICRKGSIGYATAQKIEAFFPTYPLKQLFRNPLKGYKNWKKQVAKKQVAASILIQSPAKIKIGNHNSKPPVEPAANDGHSTQPRCLYPGCTATFSFARGLCCDHYWAARDYVRKRKTTWAQLEAQGKARPAKKQSRSEAAEWFLDNNTEKKAEHQ